MCIVWVKHKYVYADIRRNDRQCRAIWTSKWNTCREEQATPVMPTIHLHKHDKRSNTKYNKGLKLLPVNKDNKCSSTTVRHANWRACFYSRHHSLFPPYPIQVVQNRNTPPPLPHQIKSSESLGKKKKKKQQEQEHHNS